VGLVANGIAFSPDYSKVISPGAPASTSPMWWQQDPNQRRFTDCDVEGCMRPDGHRVDVAGMSGPVRPRAGLYG